jgi:hypothetical protein
MASNSKHFLRRPLQTDVSAPSAKGLGPRMPRSYVTLAEHPGDMVRLACTRCERRGQYRKSTLLARASGLNMAWSA